ncbi:hypothetical protein CIK05_02340 [Bdellovibrio sp. qaytius]|nr:hypothetical protein CIK05_02340 [Bdellovibrio sp. qaytius]
MVTVRNVLPEDFEAIVHYWTENSAEYWAERGVDKSKISSRSEFLSRFEKNYAQTGDLPYVCIICEDEKAIGLHSITHLIENESAVMHAHIFNSSDRKKGIAYFSYPLAMNLFINKLNLKKIIFKTPKINLGANKVKLKLGIPCIGETIFEAPMLFKPLEANLYEVDRTLLNQLLEKIKA